MTLRRVVGVALCCAATQFSAPEWSASAAVAAEQPRTMADVKRVFELLNEGEYLKAGELIDQIIRATGGSDSPVKDLGDQVASFMPGYAKGAPPETGKRAPLPPDVAQELVHVELRDALTEIVDRARQTNIVVLNEEHLAPRDRAFALEVARALRPLGYSTLAAEAFSNKSDLMATLEADRYPRMQTGLYTKEPIFGDFVRQSLRLGYRPVAYEQVLDPKSPPPKDRLAAREQAQADNLVQTIFSKDSKAKVLVYVGYSHAAEKPLANEEWMAARLKRETGLDPLTIDQATISPTMEIDSDRAVYAALAPRLGKRSVVMILHGNPVTLGTMAGVVDLQVVHPLLRLEHGRPDWLKTMNRKRAPVLPRLRPKSGSILVQAFIAGEDKDAVPVDQVIVRSKGSLPDLMVPNVPIRLGIRTGLQLAK